jgi:predicted N-acetyltransferase YhbS
VRLQVFDTLPDDVAARLAPLLDQCFRNTGRTDAWLVEHRDRFCSQDDVLKHVVAFDDESVVGFARAYRRTISLHGRAVVLGGLGDVCTDLARRHAGIATAVVRLAVDELHAAECDIAYLCAAVTNPGIVHLYGQVGFVPLGHPHTYRGRSGTRYTDDDAMIAPVRSTTVFQQVLADDQPFDIGVGNW